MNYTLFQVVQGRAAYSAWDGQSNENRHPGRHGPGRNSVGAGFSPRRSRSNGMGTTASEACSLAGGAMESGRHFRMGTKAGGYRRSRQPGGTVGQLQIHGRKSQADHGVASRVGSRSGKGHSGVEESAARMVAGEHGDHLRAHLRSCSRRGVGSNWRLGTRCSCKLAIQHRGGFSLGSGAG